jgi:hypothetical protein
MIDEINRQVEIARKADNVDVFDEAVRALLEIAEKLGHEESWAYYQINPNKYVVDVRVLHSIAQVKGYGKNWVSRNRKKLREQSVSEYSQISFS